MHTFFQPESISLSLLIGQNSCSDRPQESFNLSAAGQDEAFQGKPRYP